MIDALHKRKTPVWALLAGVALVTAVVSLAGSLSIFFLAAVVLLSLSSIIAITGFRWFYSLLFFAIPFSVEIPLHIGDSKILFPSEGFAVILGLVFIIGMLLVYIPKKAWMRHPVTVLLLLYIAALIFTTATSQIFVVSLKFSLINILYICVFFFLALFYFNDRKSEGFALYLIYGAAVFPVILYTLYNHAGYHFDKSFASMVVNPFYTDHAIYSACLAMLLPAFLAVAAYGRRLKAGLFLRLASVVMTVFLITGIFLSSSRAAWISVFAMAGLWAFLKLRLTPGLFLVVFISGMVALYFQQDALVHRFKLNHNVSSAPGVSIEEQTKSITNLSTDVSNAERINRWSCAWRMFLDRPLTGFGPGTYQFEYLRYQRPGEMTRISVKSAYNNPPGKGGSAHSEYLLALSESGLPGMLFLGGAFIVSIILGMKAFYRANEEKDKMLLMVAMCSIFTYMVHVLFNNYLNIDKTASLFWSGLALLVFVDVKTKKEGAEPIKTVAI